MDLDEPRAGRSLASWPPLGLIGRGLGGSPPGRTRLDNIAGSRYSPTPLILHHCRRRDAGQMARFGAFEAMSGMDEFLAGQQGGAEDAGVVAEGGRLDADAALGIREGPRLGRGPDQVDVGGAQGAGDTASDDNNLRAEDVDEAADPQP